MQLYQVIVNMAQAIVNCRKSGNKEWEDKHEATLNRLVSECLPSGSDFDNGTKIDLFDLADPDVRLLFTTTFHHKNEDGIYEGRTNHEVYVYPLTRF